VGQTMDIQVEVLFSQVESLSFSASYRGVGFDVGGDGNADGLSIVSEAQTGPGPNPVPVPAPAASSGGGGAFGWFSLLLLPWAIIRRRAIGST